MEELIPPPPSPPPQPFYSLFPGSPGWTSARRELLDFMVQGKINTGRHTDHLAGRHSIRTNQCPPPPSPIFFTGRMPFLPPNQQHQSTEGNQCIRIREKTLSSTVLPALSPYHKNWYHKNWKELIQNWYTEWNVCKSLGIMAKNARWWKPEILRNNVNFCKKISVIIRHILSC